MKSIALALLLGLAPAAFAEEAKKDEAAEALFKKVEEKYAGAKTVQYSVKMVAKSESDSIDMTMSVACKAGNLFVVSGEGNVSAMDLKMEMKSDGKKMKSLLNGAGGKISDVTQAREGLLRGGMVRAGLFTALDDLEKKELPKMEEQYPVKDLKSEADEKVGERAAKVISFTVSVKGKEASVAVRLWIDADTSAVLKREGKSTDGETSSEAYTGTTFDAEIADEKFALPK